MKEWNSHRYCCYMAPTSQQCHLAMEESSKKEVTSKTKRLKSDRIKHVLSSYYQKRNFKCLTPRDMPLEEYRRYKNVESKVSQPNMLFYACWNNKEAFVIDGNFCKFINWLKDVRIKNGPTDLEYLTAPLFCYMYLEFLRKGLVEQATAFFRMHINSVDKLKCDSTVKQLINAISNNTTDLNGIKDTFRSNKYVVSLSPVSCRLLKKFVQTKCHVVFLQMLALWFHIRETMDEKPSEDDDDKETTEKPPVSPMCNGHVHFFRSDLEERIAQVKAESSHLYTVHLNNVKHDVSCGLSSRNNGLIAYCHGNSTYVRSVGTMRKLRNADCKEIIFRNHTDRIYDIGIVDKHKLLVTASCDRNISMYSLANYSRHAVLRGHNYPVYSLASSGNGAYLISGSYDATIRLWSLHRNSTLRICAGHKQEVTSLDFHPNSVYFASSSADKAVRMWTISAAMPVRLLYGSEGPVYCVRFSPNGRLIACCGEDKVLRVWDILASKQLLEMKCGKEPVRKIRWSDDQKSLVTGSTDGVVCTWNMDKILKNPTETSLHEPISSCTLSAKILDIEYSQESFSCLTVQSRTSTYNNCSTLFYDNDVSES